MRLFILFSVLISFYFDGCISEKHVLFIHDTMDTTGEHKQNLEREVKKVATQIFETEPDYNFQIIYSYESKIEKIKKFGDEKSENYNPTKVQSTLKTLLKWLQESPSNSVIYVITDVTHPSEECLVPKILEIIQIKRTEVNFILTSQYFNHPLDEYRSISFVSNGFVQFNWYTEYFDFRIIEHSQNSLQYHITHDRVDRLADLVYLGLKYTSQKVPLTSIDHSYRGFHCFTVDPFMTEVTAMIHANYHEYRPRYSILKNYKQKMLSRIYNMDCISIDIIEDSMKTTLQNSSIYSLRVFSKSEFNFNYGFSIDSVDSFDKTYIRPIKGRLNRIYVSTNKKVEILSFEIILKNGFLLNRTHLDRVKNNANIFEGFFEPPGKEYFHIKIFARGGIIRMTSTAINAANDFGEDQNNPRSEGIKISSHDMKSANDLDKDENNPVSEPDSVNLEPYLLIVISLCLVVIFGEIVWYIRFFRKSPELPPLELEKSHRQAVSNIYYPVTYQVRNQKVEMV